MVFVMLLQITALFRFDIYFRCLLFFIVIFIYVPLPILLSHNLICNFLFTIKISAKKYSNLKMKEISKMENGMQKYNYVKNVHIRIEWHLLKILNILYMNICQTDWLKSRVSFENPKHAWDALTLELVYILQLN